MLLRRLSALEPSICFPALLPRRSSLIAESVNKKPGAKAAGLREPSLSLLTCRQRLPCYSMESRLETACDTQVLIVPLCSHVRLHQESCVKQQTTRSEEGDAAGGSTQRNLGSAGPAQLNSTAVKIIPPSVLFVTIHCQKLLSDAP